MRPGNPVGLQIRPSEAPMSPNGLHQSQAALMLAKRRHDAFLDTTQDRDAWNRDTRWCHKVNSHGKIQVDRIHKALGYTTQGKVDWVLPSARTQSDAAFDGRANGSDYGSQGGGSEFLHQIGMLSNFVEAKPASTYSASLASSDTGHGRDYTSRKLPDPDTYNPHPAIQSREYFVSAAALHKAKVKHKVDLKHSTRWERIQAGSVGGKSVEGSDFGSLRAGNDTKDKSDSPSKRPQATTMAERAMTMATKTMAAGGGGFAPPKRGSAAASQRSDGGSRGGGGGDGRRSPRSGAESARGQGSNTNGPMQPSARGQGRSDRRIRTNGSQTAR